MKTLKFLSTFLAVFAVLMANSCSVIGGIFKTGIGVGIFGVIAVAAIVFIVILLLRKGKGQR